MPIGGATTVKFIPFDCTPFTMTTTLPDVAPLGTCAEMLVAFQLEMGACVPLNCTILVAVPKLVPPITMVAPGDPEFWLRVVMLGGAVPPAAALKATTAAPQGSDELSDALAETDP